MSSAGNVASPNQRAFPSHPCVDRYFPSASAEECRSRLMRVIERADGPALVIGAPGIGKTMLMNVLAGSLADRLDVVSITSTQLCTRRALLQAILFGLGLPYAQREEGELRLALVERLRDQPADRAGVALLIDEAQALPIRLLEELRVLTNTVRNGQPVLRLVLAGSSALEEQFASTELESFNQRLAARCYLAPLSYQETHQYVRAHVAAAGANPDELFATAALDCIYTACDGVPRLVNQLCDRAILLAVDRGVESIGEPLVQEAWSDLHQLPAPWHTPEAAMPEPEANVVEFGVLPEPPADEFEAPLAAVESEGDWNADSALTVISQPELAPASIEPEPSETVSEPDVKAVVQLDQPAPAPDIDVAPLPVPDPVSTPVVELKPETVPTSAALTESLEPTPDAASLFGDEFDDEELVIDRFASLEFAVANSTSVATLDAEQTFAAITTTEAAPPAVSSDACCGRGSCQDACDLGAPSESLEAAEPELVQVLPMTVVSTEPAEVSAATEAEGQANELLGGVLIIEPEPTEPANPAPEAERREYRQLFASLRREG